MIKLGVLAAELNLWANETEQIYRATKEIKYRRDTIHLRYLAATLNQSTDAVSPGLYAQTADSIVITNTTVATTLVDGGVGTLTIPADSFKVGDSFIAYLSGKISSVNNEQLEIRCMSNGFTLADTGLITLATTTNKNWELYINFTVRSIGTSGIASIATSGRFAYNKNAGNSPESIGFYNLNNTTFNTTISNTLNVTAQWTTASTSNSIYTDMFNLYRVF
jgi:hypothetical protein